MARLTDTSREPDAFGASCFGCEPRVPVIDVSESLPRRVRPLLVGVILALHVAPCFGGSIEGEPERWLPIASGERAAYERYRADFGSEERIVVLFDASALDGDLVEALAARIDRLPSVRECWTRDRMEFVLREAGVTEVEARSRMRDLLPARNEGRTGFVIIPSPEGFADPARLLANVRAQLDYCRLPAEAATISGLTGADPAADEGGRSWLWLAGLSCVLPLRLLLGRWTLAGSIAGLGVLSAAVIDVVAGSVVPAVPAVLGPLILVGVIGSATIVARRRRIDPAGTRSDRGMLVGAAVVFGLALASVVPLIPAANLAILAAGGTLGVLVIARLLLPAVLERFPPTGTRAWDGPVRGMLLCLERPRVTTVVGVLAVAVAAIGLARIDLAPTVDDPVAANGGSVEVVLDLAEVPTERRVAEVRRVERIVAGHIGIKHTLSAATFVPRWESVLESDVEGIGDGFVRSGGRRYRISGRLADDVDIPAEVVEELREATSDLGVPVLVTGLVPLRDHARQAILADARMRMIGLSAIAGLVVAGIVLLRNRGKWVAPIAAGVIIAPVVLVLGTLGWLGRPIGVATLWAIAPTIVVGTLVTGLYLADYDHRLRLSRSSRKAARVAVLVSGGTMVAIVAAVAVGLLAVGLGPSPVATRFGWTAAMMLAAIPFTNLVLLPAILSLRSGRNVQERRLERLTRRVRRPHVLDRGRRVSSLVERAE